MRATGNRGRRGTTTVTLSLLLAAAAAPLGAQPQRLSVRPGGWVATQLTVQPGDRVMVMGAGGQISCGQCSPPVVSGPRGVGGNYRLYAGVGNSHYELGEAREFVAREGGQVFLTIGNIAQNQAGAWQGAYDVQIIRYPGAGGGTTPPPTSPPPTPPPAAAYPFTAWMGADCGKLGTEGILEGQLRFPGGGLGVACPIYIEDWVVNGDPVWVCLPGAIPGDNWGGHPSGIVVNGFGFVNSWYLSGYQAGFAEGQPRHPGHSVYTWNIYFAARPQATSATIRVGVVQGRSCAEAGGRMLTFDVPVVVRPAVRGTPVSMAAFFWTGYQTATALTAASANWDPTVTRNALVAGQQWAAHAAGFLVPNAWTDLANRVAQGGNAAVAGPIQQLHAQLTAGLQRSCTCGTTTTTMGHAYSLGFNACLAELATLYGWDRRTLQGYLTLLQQQAPASGLLRSTDVDGALHYLNQGYDSRALKDYVAGMRSNMAQALGVTCTCR